jgi:uncharacterized protein YegL
MNKEMHHQELIRLLEELKACCNDADRERLERVIMEQKKHQKLSAVDALPVPETPLKNDLAELLFIIDQSGSMSGDEREWAVVKNFNEVIAQQRTVAGRALVSTVLFNNKMTTMYASIPIEQAPKLTRKDYAPRGLTALLDAVGASIERICTRQAALPEAERPATTIVVIITDGQENCSQTYMRSVVKQMIQTLQEKHNWKFLYFGANVDHFAEAHNLGIKEENAASFKTTKAGIRRGLLKCRYCIIDERSKFFL